MFFCPAAGADRPGIRVGGNRFIGEVSLNVGGKVSHRFVAVGGLASHCLQADGFQRLVGVGQFGHAGLRGTVADLTGLTDIFARSDMKGLIAAARDVQTLLPMHEIRATLGRAFRLVAE